ncbi:DUF2147 domain-containing protein [Rhodoblastus sp.]|uniref:DUF2147 domain-containing protein n=1 Tax=Rhodoblastus sp. TaxID=1962975 RepID=UPI0035B3E3F9
MRQFLGRPFLGRLREARRIRAVAGLAAAALIGAATAASAENAKEGAKPAAPVAQPAAHPAGPALNGFWQAYNDDGRPGGVFFFYEKNGFYEGRLVKAVTYPDEPPDDPLCKACPGEKKNQPMMGLVIVYGMKRHGAKYEDGHILDPRDGKIWSAEVEVTQDNQKLNLRGYIGTPLLGQTRVWTRLPDDTMAAADIPGEPIGGADAGHAKKPTAQSAGAPAAAKPATAAPKAQ